MKKRPHDRVPAVLLVEFVNADQFPGQIQGEFPFFKGWLSHHGAANAWLRFGISTDNLLRHHRDEVTLSHDELARLETALFALKAGLLFTTHPLFLGHRRRLKARFPGLRVAVWGSGVPEVRWLVRRLEPGGAERFTHESVLDRPDVPIDYRWDPGNPAASKPEKNLVRLVADGVECAYNKPVAANPCYASVVLPGGAKAYGCAFCGHDMDVRSRPASAATSRRWIAKQLREVVRTLGPDRLPKGLILQNISAVSQLDDVLRGMRRLGMAETTLLVAARVDHLLAARPLLERRLSAMSGRREAVHLHTVGLENFSDAELRRFNKGFDSLAAVRAVNMLKELEARHPRRFHFSGYLPLGFILFTPWTRLEDLRRNLRLIQHFELEYDTGSLFNSRLRLHPDLSITALADRDGLLTDSVEEGLRLNRRKLFGYERPWRFQDPRVEPINSLAVRLDPGPSFAGDALFERVRSRLGSVSRKQAVAALLAMVSAADEIPLPTAPEELLERGLEGARGPVPPLDRPSARFRVGAASLTAPEFLAAVRPLAEQGIKPVLSLEGLTSSELEACDPAGLGRAGLSTAVWGEGPLKTLFVSRRSKDLERMLAAAPDFDADDPAALRRAHRQAGALFGIPSCCVRAWTRRDWLRVGPDGWALLDWRCRHPGPVPAVLNPLLVPDISFLPCSPRCKAAVRVLARWLDALGVKAQDGRVYVFSLEDRWDSASCVPSNADPRSIRLGRGSVEGPACRLADLLRRSDRVSLGRGETSLGRGSRLLGSWIAEVAVWDPRSAEDPDFWTELARAALRRKDPCLRRKARLDAEESLGMSLDRAAASGRLQADLFRP